MTARQSFRTVRRRLCSSLLAVCLFVPAPSLAGSDSLVSDHHSSVVAHASISSVNASVVKTRQQEVCDLGPNDAAKICFDSKPLEVNHCLNTMTLHFLVKRHANEHYYFTYHVERANDPTSLDGPPDALPPYTPRYKLTQDDYSDETVPLRIPYPGKGLYSVEITVHLENDPNIITGRYYGVLLTDGPIVAAVIVGVSNYDNGQDPPPPISESSLNNSSEASAPGESLELVDLQHADQDAKTFDSLLKQAYPDSKRTLLTSDNPEALPTRKNLRNTLQDVRDNNPFCTSRTDDWFIFYFSGHGVLVDDGTNFTHYLATMDFNRNDPKHTGMLQRELLYDAELLDVPNVLLILDSCFSGFSLSSPRPRDPARHPTVLAPSTKGRFVKGDAYVPFFEEGERDQDEGSLESFQKQEENSGHRAMILAAAERNHTAQEGFVRVVDRKIIFTPSERETKEQREKGGHGLFTYVLLSELISRMSDRFPAIDLQGINAKPTEDLDTCDIDFDRAAIATKAALQDLHAHNSTYQVSDVLPNKFPLVPLACTLSRIEGASSAPYNH